ncbi:hypothetical protein SEA_PHRAPPUCCINO_24 [Mycobacterium phage Phrappuccino]|uniref:Uncharacterized protein n=1 Tax=Mycobacterium phage Phrappuccino TaxID=2591223 RepID=A0A514DDL6_9CAUD|nr:hypothetical protein KHQ87_gp024 [Mycobacterium phage Phrappuccino]QDH91702.1 hypothetical protein SEA_PHRAPPUCCINO_24 [Mycobacterium phage Phrappuccino]QIQ63146.1 hypothetical protein SEA_SETTECANDELA_24 [Mycobacterium phage Settecandela]
MITCGSALILYQLSTKVGSPSREWLYEYYSTSFTILYSGVIPRQQEVVMAIPRIPRLDTKDWKINGDSLIAWISDTEFFDISPSEQGHKLTVNHVGHAQSVFLGHYIRISEAQAAARQHIGDE